MTKSKKKKTKKKQTKSIVATGKRKQAVARATIKEGKGLVRINSVPLDLVEPKILRMRIQEPLMISGDLKDKVDIKVNVKGGGVSGQADATRLAVANALLRYSNSEELKEKMLEYDRRMLVADPRRKETRKPGPSRARSAAQKSKR
jgi:small subunit ribosomal protein S9